MQYCGWQESRTYEPPLSLHKETGEGNCPLCGKLAYPLDELVNLYGESNVSES
jgi:hypothetical protein